ncbi:hypothetical protein AAFF_G00408730 [Aldrovandia affinis]|uniref:Myosin motor domain-containing protein n=1 Tax=Aldrovandia affinis TaxID=143900 RepID=A0AAD7SCE9_9TELE|nr:hypothetical protein AAFF_G00408730 [Aldrovandia affinis]
MAPAKSTRKNEQKTKAQQKKSVDKSSSAKIPQDDAAVDCGKKKGKKEPIKPENAVASKSKLAVTNKGRKDELATRGKKGKEDEAGKVKRDQKSEVAPTKKQAVKKTGKESTLNGKTLPVKETSKVVAGKGVVNKAAKSKLVSKQVTISATKFGKKQGSKVVESEEEESETEEESSEQELGTEDPESSEGAEEETDGNEESVKTDAGPEEEPSDTENDVEKKEEEEDVGGPTANPVPKGEPEEEPSSSSGSSEEESESEEAHSDRAEENDAPSKSAASPKKAGPLKLTTRLLGQGGKVKSKIQLKKEPVPAEKLKPAPTATKAFQMKGLVLNKNVQDKGRSQMLQLAKAAKTTKNKPQADREEKKTASPSKSPLIKDSRIMLTMKLNKKEARGNQDAKEEPTKEEQSEGANKQKHCLSRPQNIGRVLGKVKMASIRSKARIKEEERAALELAEAESSRPTDRLIARRKGMNTLRRVSGWIQKKMPKSRNLRAKIIAVAQAISISRWLTAQALKRQSGTSSSKRSLFRRRMAMRITSATSLTKKAQLPASEAKEVTEKKATPPESHGSAEAQGDSSDDARSSPLTGDSQSEADEKANAADAKYAIVFPRMHKIGKAKGGSPASTSSTASAVTGPKRVPPKPGARLVLPVQPDLTILKSIKKSVGGKQPDNNDCPTGNSGNKEPQGTVASRKAALEGKDGLSALHAVKGKLGAPQLKLSNLTVPKPPSGTGLKLEQGSSGNDREKSGLAGMAVEDKVDEQVLVSSFYEEEADREVAQLMREGVLSPFREVHWAQGRPLRSDPHDWLRGETLLPHQTVEKLSKWSREADQSKTIPNYNGRGPWEAEDAAQNMLESRLNKTQVYMPGSSQAVEVDEVEDLSQLEEVCESSVLLNLKKRFHRDFIYTYIGNMLLSVNPFKTLSIYTEELSLQYYGKEQRRNPPHVYAIADSAFSQSQNSTQEQCIVISGQSGSGKTEATKLIVQYLSTMYQGKTEGLRQPMEVLPILDSFGNAKTILNNNSSRFGKYLHIHILVLLWGPHCHSTSLRNRELSFR